MWSLSRTNGSRGTTLRPKAAVKRFTMSNCGPEAALAAKRCGMRLDGHGAPEEGCQTLKSSRTAATLAYAATWPWPYLATVFRSTPRSFATR
jgi:hypothetical protein